MYRAIALFMYRAIALSVALSRVTIAVA